MPTDMQWMLSGGGSGLGKAICKRLAAEKAHVLVTDLQLEPAEQVARDIAQAGGRATAIQARSNNVTTTASTHFRKFEQKEIATVRMALKIFSSV